MKPGLERQEVLQRSSPKNNVQDITTNQDTFSIYVYDIIERFL
jgi:hypothetical protein